MPTRIAVVMRMIKFSHSLFALPFALSAFLIYADLSGAWQLPLALIILAMVSARSAAMAFNRLVDRHIDAKNPRTRNRELPRGLLSTPFVIAFTALMLIIFLICAALLHPLALALSPIAVLFLFGYSYTKRFTFFSHLILGTALALAPAGVMVALAGSVDPRILPLFAAVALWVCGFDIIYSLADAAFDRKHRLRSVPADLGIRAAQVIAPVSHALFILLLIVYGVIMQFGIVYALSLAAIAVLLGAGYIRLIQRSYRDDDGFFFFTVNAGVSILFLAGMLLERLI